jgi:hypothetical protein
MSVATVECLAARHCRPLFQVAIFPLVRRLKAALEAARPSDQRLDFGHPSALPPLKSF